MKRLFLCSAQVFTPTPDSATSAALSLASALGAHTVGIESAYGPRGSKFDPPDSSWTFLDSAEDSERVDPRRVH